MPSLPLVSHDSPDSIIAWRADGAVTLRQFLAEVRQLAALFPAGGHLLNMCGDRYRFSVGLAAAIVAGKVSLLPPTPTPEVVRQIKIFAPDVFCLTDSVLCAIDLPQLQYPVMGLSQAGAVAVPQIEATQRVAVVFTSGSTGTPQPHPKNWGHWSLACKLKHCTWDWRTTRPAPSLAPYRRNTCTGSNPPC